MSGRIILFFILLITLACSKENNKLDSIEIYIGDESKQTFINALDFFDSFLKERYPNINDSNERTYLFLKENEAYFYTNTKDKKEIETFLKDLTPFNDYINKIQQTGLLDLLVSEHFFDVSVTNDKRVKQWIDSIDRSEMDKLFPGKKKYLYDKNDTLSISKDNITKKYIDQLSKKKKYYNNRNILYYSFYKITHPSDSIVKKVIIEAVGPFGINPLVTLQSPKLRKELSNPIIQSLVFYNTVIKLYDLDLHKIKNPRLRKVSDFEKQ